MKTLSEVVNYCDKELLSKERCKIYTYSVSGKFVALTECVKILAENIISDKKDNDIYTKSPNTKEDFDEINRKIKLLETTTKLLTEEINNRLRTFMGIPSILPIRFECGIIPEGYYIHILKEEKLVHDIRGLKTREEMNWALRVVNELLIELGDVK